MIQAPPKVIKCHKSCKNSKFQFSRHQFEFDFSAPKIFNFSVSLGPLNFALQQSGFNQKMPLIKVVQIGLLYHQLRAFFQILTLTIVTFFEKVQEKSNHRKNALPCPPGNNQNFNQLDGSHLFQQQSQNHKYCCTGVAWGVQFLYKTNFQLPIKQDAETSLHLQCI